LSPSGSTAATLGLLTIRSEVYLSRQLEVDPFPPLKLEFPGSQAMSPAVAMTGAALADPAMARVHAAARARRRADRAAAAIRSMLTQPWRSGNTGGTYVIRFRPNLIRSRGLARLHD
jgi:hypothetical protein